MNKQLLTFGVLLLTLGISFYIYPLLFQVIPTWQHPTAAVADHSTVWAGRSDVTGSSLYAIDGNKSTSWTSEVYPTRITFKLDKQYIVTKICITIIGHVNSHGLSFKINGTLYSIPFCPEISDVNTISLAQPLNSSEIILDEITPNSIDDWVEISEFYFYSPPTIKPTPTPTPPWTDILRNASYFFIFAGTSLIVLSYFKRK
jgi:hypothetical protein